MAKNYTLKLKGYVGGWDFDPDYVDYVLDKNKDKEVTVAIDSLGGSLFSGVSVASSFRMHGNVTAVLVAHNASAATIAAMGAKRVEMDRTGMFLVHKASQLVFKFIQANSDQIQQIIDSLDKTRRDLEKFDMQIAAAYAARCKKDRKTLLELMKKDTWLTPEEALAWGFVDEIVDLGQEPRKISGAVACAMQEEGIPLPPGFSRKSVWSRLKDAFLTADISANNPIDMTDELKKVCAAAGAGKIEAVDGNVSLTAAQAKALEKCLDDKDKEIEDLKAKIEAMKKEPGAKPVSVVNEQAGPEPEDDFLAAIQDARDMFNSLP